MINPTLCDADFDKLPESTRKAFRFAGLDDYGADAGDKRKLKPIVVTIPVNTMLYKLTSYPLATTGVDPSRGVTAWWCPVEPFTPDGKPHYADKLGARGMYQEADLNKVSMAEMARFACAVRIDWNTVEQYHEVQLNQSAKAFWGLFSPQPAVSPDLDTAGQGKVQAFKTKNPNVYVPDILGGIDYWQFYIPNLTYADVTVKSTIPANDMKTLKMKLLFGLAKGTLNAVT